MFLAGDEAETIWQHPAPIVGFVTGDMDRGDSDTDDRTGVMLVRAWLHEGQLVARLHSSVSGDTGQQAEVVVGLEQIQLAVELWLRAFAEMPA